MAVTEHVAKSHVERLPMWEMYDGFWAYTRWIIYGVAVIVVASFIYGWWQRIKAYRMGRQATGVVDQPVARVGELLKLWIAQLKVLKETYQGLFHLMLFWGFVVLFIGTSVTVLDEDFWVWIFGQPKFIQGNFYVIFSFLLDLFGLLAIVGVVLALYRRYVIKPKALDNKREDATLLLFILAILVTGFLAEGGRIGVVMAQKAKYGYEVSSFVGYGIGKVLGGNPFWHKLFWTLHIVISLTFVATIPYTKALHIFSTGGSIFTHSLKPAGKVIEPIPNLIARMEAGEDVELGYKRIDQLNWREILQLDACTRCGRCQDQCPAYNTGKHLSPKNFIQSVKTYWLAKAAALRNADVELSGKEGAAPAPGQDPNWSVADGYFMLESEAKKKLTEAETVKNQAVAQASGLKKKIEKGESDVEKKREDVTKAEAKLAEAEATGDEKKIEKAKQAVDKKKEDVDKAIQKIEEAKAGIAEAEQAAAKAEAEFAALKLKGEVSTAVLWDCTNCMACMNACPVMIEHVPLITAMRRELAMEFSDVEEACKTYFQNMENNSNPWGFNPAERAKWAADEGLPTVLDKPDYEYLWYIGDLGSYDPKAIKANQALYRILKEAGVNFAILPAGAELSEGDSLRRLGNESAFQALVNMWKESLQALEIDPTFKGKKVFTTDPHAYNCLKHEYPDFGFAWQVFHHTELLDGLIKQGKIKFKGGNGKSAVFHDSCFLSRYNGIMEAPRNILKAAGFSIKEPERHGLKTFCCGGGGGRAWLEEHIDEANGIFRINNNRADELGAVGADNIVYGCPLCGMMFDEACKRPSMEKVMENTKLVELSEIVADNMIFSETKTAEG